MADNGTILALDVGAKRIGLAIATSVARIASPIGAVANDEATMQGLQALCRREGVKQIVVGLPRSLEGQETNQTTAVRNFGKDLAKNLALPVHWQDEAVTSAQAEAELSTRRKPYSKEDVDALAATYILEDYLNEAKKDL